MFDIGFPELLLLSVVALIVIGPDKLPQTIRTMSLWVHRLRRSLNSIKAEIEAEIGADELRQQIHNEEIMRELKESREALDGLVNDAKSGVRDMDEATRKLTSIPTGPEKDDREPTGNSGN